MKIAIAQINPKVGDISGNTAKIESFARRAGELGADLAVFPELAVTGYPPLLAGHLIRRYGLAPGARLVDLACGRGEMLAAFAHAGLSVTGLDQAPDAGSCAPGLPILQADVAK